MFQVYNKNSSVPTVPSVPIVDFEQVSVSWE